MLKKSLVLVFSVLPSLALLPGYATASDAAALHKEQCTACHTRMTGGDGTILYTRKERLVTTPEQLAERVDYCAKGANTGWDSSTVDHITQWLDEHYYKFDL